MGLFKKRGKKEEIPSLPELPQLPELPEFPETEEYSDENIPQLPSFPNGSLGNRFSQNIIKEAVTGRKEVEEVDADEFAEEREMQTMRKPLVRESGEKEFFPTFEKIVKTREAEPIFIRIDKFEDGSKTFEQVKKKILEIEDKFDDIKKIKEDEEKELEFWGKEIKEIKEKIERIDRNIFSKID